VSTAAISIGQSLAGGALIGAGAAVLMAGNARVAGISGIIDRVLGGHVGEQAWRVAFLVGLMVPALLLGSATVGLKASPEILAISGGLVGYGARLGGGCTSGHGVCGLANLSLRSAVATVTFIVVAAVTVALRHALGAA